MRQKIRRTLAYMSLLLFPVTLNFFSPYVSIDGAFQGLISGSVLMFVAMFITATFMGRAWCGWLCPMSGLSEMAMTVNSKNAASKKLKWVRYGIFTIWFSILAIGFVIGGGFLKIAPLHLTENVISVDEPMKYGIYYTVLFTFFALSLLLGKRGACHSICWMSPFLVAGTKLGRLLKIPQIRINASTDQCIDCKKCNVKCPMSIQVSNQVKLGRINTTDCILCGECVDICPKKVLKFN